jgi:hypothetical protein
MQSYNFPNINVYEARNKHWSGQILKSISGGESLYLKDNPWGFTIHCNSENQPHSVEFENGILWSFCSLGARILNIEWPQFARDFRKDDTRCHARIERIFSDSFHLTLKSDESLVNDILVWKYPPRGGRNGLSYEELLAEMPVCI